MTEPSAVDLVEQVARAICEAHAQQRWPGNEKAIRCQVENGWDLWEREARAAIEVQSDTITRLQAENADLKLNVIAFLGPWAERCARDHELPRGHLYPAHFDILERCGARMTDFTRASVGGEQTKGGKNEDQA